MFIPIIWVIISYFTEKLKFKPEPVTTKLELETKAEVPCRADGDTQPKVR